jgi:hypothetical protein
MNEDGTAVVDTSNGEEGQETATSEEVAEVLGLNKPETVTEEELNTETEEEVKNETDGSDSNTEQSEAGAGQGGEETAASNESNSTASTGTEAEEAPSFALEVEDANGEKITINPGDNLEEVLKDFEPKTNGQIFQIIKDVMKMESDKEAYDADQKTAAQEAAHAETLANIHAGWDKEISTLQADKRMPVSADPNNPSKEFTERRDAVFKFMAEENDKRREDGRPLLQSFEDALDKLENREAKESKIEAAKKEKELARERGGMIGGSSAPAGSSSPVYRPGSARNANEALSVMGITG